MTGSLFLDSPKAFNFNVKSVAMSIKIDERNIILKDTLVTFLEMHDRPAEALPRLDGVSFVLLEKPIAVDNYREYYYAVGKKHHWVDRLIMEDSILSDALNASNTDIYLMDIQGVPAGYAEFIREKDFVEVLYFGLFPEFIGKGLGKYFLQWVIAKAWSYAPQWIQLNTCELDHPHALNNYISNGFKVVRTEIHKRRILLTPHE